MNAATPQPTPTDPQWIKYLQARREALLRELAALEDYMGLPRSAQPRQERREQRERERAVCADVV